MLYEPTETKIHIHVFILVLYSLAVLPMVVCCVPETPPIMAPAHPENGSSSGTEWSAPPKKTAQ